MDTIAILLACVLLAAGAIWAISCDECNRVEDDDPTLDTRNHLDE